MIAGIAESIMPADLCLGLVSTLGHTSGLHCHL